jgi:hypothetical protein
MHARHPPSVYWRRRLLALLPLLLLAAFALRACAGGEETANAPSGQPAAERGQQEAGDRPEPAELPGGGRRFFPDRRVVGLYGAPQDEELGALGIGSPDRAAQRLRRIAAGYERKTRPVLGAFELIAVIANADPGADGLYRTRQSDEVIGRYLRAARRAKAVLLLDIQPGHADFLTETKALRRWLREPDVGLALDPEWHTPGAKPGTQIGSVTAEKVNEVSRYLADVVREGRLPQKLFVIHQFTFDMIRDLDRVERPAELATVLNVDGFGDRPNKRSKYAAFTKENGGRFHDGFKLFFREDVNRMAPKDVLALQPPPDLVVYE